MSQPTCPPPEALAAFQCGTLSSLAFDSVAQHVDSCSICLAFLEQIEAAASPWRATLRTAPPTEKFEQEPQCRQALDRASAAVRQALENTGRAGSVSDRSPPARRVDRYELLERVGEGGMGEVYKARHIHTEEVVALKLVPADKMKTPGTTERFFREIKAQARLRHRHVVRAWDGGMADGRLFLVMDYAPGLSLDRLLRRHGRLPVADACEAARQAALGLQHAFENGLVHRDLKPSNLMLTTDQPDRLPKSSETSEVSGSGLEAVVKILDLGLAKVLYSDPDLRDELTAAGYIMGTADYMAPEQWADPRQADIRADLYSLGCTLYHLLAGQAPFGDKDHDTWHKKMTAHEHQPVPPIQQYCPAVPEELAAVLDRLLAKRPEERYATPGEAAQALEPFCPGSNLARLLEDSQAPGVATASWHQPPLRGKGPTVAAAVHATKARRRIIRSLRWMPWWLRAAGVLFGIGMAVFIAVNIVSHFAMPLDSVPGGEGVAPASYHGSVDILVLRKNALGQPDLLSLQDFRALPLAPGDRFRVEATVEPPGYLYLFWINSAGTAEPLYPWEEWKEVGLPREEKVVPRISVPDEMNKGFKFKTPGTGLETLLMLARSTPLTDSAEEVQSWFAELPDGRPLPAENYRAWFEDFQLVKNDPTRRALFEREDLGMPAFRLQAALQPRLAGHAELIRAVSFAAVKRAKE
jgi:serine/threonine protein kinase